MGGWGDGGMGGWGDGGMGIRCCFPGSWVRGVRDCDYGEGLELSGITSSGSI